MYFPPNVELVQEIHPIYRMYFLVDGKPLLDGKTGDVCYIKPEHVMKSHTEAEELVQRILLAISTPPSVKVEQVHGHFNNII